MKREGNSWRIGQREWEKRTKPAKGEDGMNDKREYRTREKVHERMRQEIEGGGIRERKTMLNPTGFPFLTAGSSVSFSQWRGAGRQEITLIRLSVEMEGRVGVTTLPHAPRLPFWRSYHADSQLISCETGGGGLGADEGSPIKDQAPWNATKLADLTPPTRRKIFLCDLSLNIYDIQSMNKACFPLFVLRC